MHRARRAPARGRDARLTRRDEGEYQEYSTEEQRSQAGWIAARMQRGLSPRAADQGAETDDQAFPSLGGRARRGLLHRGGRRSRRAEPGRPVRGGRADGRAGSRQRAHGHAAGRRRQRRGVRGARRRAAGRLALRAAGRAADRGGADGLGRRDPLPDQYARAPRPHRRQRAAGGGRRPDLRARQPPGPHARPAPHPAPGRGLLAAARGGGAARRDLQRHGELPPQRRGGARVPRSARPHRRRHLRPLPRVGRAAPRGRLPDHELSDHRRLQRRHAGRHHRGPRDGDPPRGARHPGHPRPRPRGRRP